MTRSVPTYLSKSILPISVFPIISNSVFPFLPSSSQLRDSSLLSRQLDTLPFLKCHFGYFFFYKNISCEMFPWFWILLAVELAPVSEASGPSRAFDYYMYYCGNGVAVERERICDGVSDCQVRTFYKKKAHFRLNCYSGTIFPG